MEQSEDDLVGNPLKEVPQREPDEDCNARRDDDGRFLGYCDRTAGWGTDGDNGRCRTHGGDGGAPEGNDNAKGNNGGAPEKNTNAVSHGLYAEKNRFYQEVIGDDLRELCDEIFEDYLQRYRSRHGDPLTPDEARLFEIAVNHIKIIHGDNWAADRPEETNSGNPIVDRESKQTEYGERITYSESVVVGTQQKLRREDRAWLKDMGLLDDPESQKADAVGDLASIIKDESES